jgi:hypothetical protein
MPCLSLVCSGMLSRRKCFHSAPGPVNSPARHASLHVHTLGTLPEKALEGGYVADFRMLDFY